MNAEADHPRRTYAEAVLTTLFTKALLFATATASLWFATQLLGKEAYGVFQVVLSLVLIVALPATLGLDMAVLYRLARTPGPVSALVGGGVVRVSLLISLAVGLGFAVLLFAAAGWLERAFELAGFAPMLRLLAWTVPALAMASVFESWYRARQRMVPSILIPVLINLFRAILFGLAFLFAAGPGGVLWGEVAAAMLTLAVWFVLAPRSLYSDRGKPSRAEFGYGAKMVASKLASDSVRRLDLIMVGALSTGLEAADYSVAARLVAVVELARQLLSHAFTPRIGGHLGRGDRAALDREYAAVRAPAFAAALFAAAGLTLFGVELLALFGDFTSGYAPMLILAVGLLADTAFGQNSALLKMAGHAGWMLATRLSTLILIVFLNLLLIPPFGATGAAAGTSFALLLLNGAMFFLVLNLERIRTIGSRELALLAAASFLLVAAALGSLPPKGTGLILLALSLAYVLLEPLVWRPALDAVRDWAVLLRRRRARGG